MEHQERTDTTTTVTSNTAYTYQWFGGAAQSSITKTNGVGATSTTGYSQFYYDANGRLKAVYNPTATKQQLREYETDANGQIVQRRETEELNGWNIVKTGTDTFATSTKSSPPPCGRTLIKTTNRSTAATQLLRRKATALETATR